MVIDFITLLLNSDFLFHTKELIWIDFTLSLRSKPGPLFLLHFFLCLVQSLSHSISIFSVHCLCDRDAEDLFLTQERWECNHISQLSKYDYRLLPWMFFCTVSVLPWARFCPKCLFVQPCCRLHPWESIPATLSFPFLFCFAIESSICRYLYKEHLFKTHLARYFEGELYST